MVKELHRLLEVGEVGQVVDMMRVFSSLSVDLRKKYFVQL